MVNNSDAIKALQDTTGRHEQALVHLQKHADDQAHWNENTNKTLQEMTRQLAQISQAMGLTAHSSQMMEGDSGVSRGKAKIRSESEDVFPFAPRPVQVELPIFTGKDPEEWLASATDFFEFYNTEDHHRVTMASFRMEGTAKKWYRWMQRQRQLAGWNHLVEAIRRRFSVTEIESPEGQLTKLLQISTVEEYQTRFEELALRTTAPLTEEFLTQCFISGLRSDIKHEVLAQRPKAMMEVLALARFQEARLAESKKWLGRTNPAKLPAILPTPATGGPKMMPGRPPPLDTNAWRSQTLQPRRLSAAEAQARRDKGLCYYCDDKFAPGHKCREPQLFCFDEAPVIEADPEETVNTGIGLSASVVEEDDREKCLVSFNALAGCITPNTLRVRGEVKGRGINILIDGGSTHNFVQARTAHYLGLTISAAPNFRVLVGSGEKLRSEGCVRDLTVRVQGTEVKTDFYVLPLEGTEMVLGVAWMATLGPVTMDFAKLQFQFRQGKSEHLWQGEVGSEPQPVCLQSLRRMLDTRAVAQYYFLQCAQEVEAIKPVVHADMERLLHEFSNVFLPPMGLPPTRGHDHAIHLDPSSKPVNVKPYRYPHYQKQEVEHQVQHLLEHNLIRKSQSPFSSPVLLVKKKDGTWRFCVDYRALNAITVKDKFPIPTAEELFDELGGAQYFSKLDLLAGYHQIRVREVDIKKTAFRTHEGHYEFLVMPFGLTNAPSTFQATMNEMFRPYLRKFVLVFLDDILVYSQSWQDHLKHVRKVLQTLQINRFVAKRSKCTFGQQTVEYLGHVVSKEGLAVDPLKVEAIRAWPVPSTVKGVRGFLGIAGYYRKFIKGFATIASPLSDLLCKGTVFVWSDSAQIAFDSLKRCLCSTPVLGLPNFEKEFCIETDASGVGIGAVLHQGGRPLAFYSQKLNPRMQAASVYHREMFAITQAVGKWRQYLLGRRFSIITDQRSLRELNQQTIQTPEQQRWLTKLIGYDFDIRYRPGKLNQVADALSREGAASCMAISRPLFGVLEDIRVATIHDLELQELLAKIHACDHDTLDFVDQGGVVLFRGRLMVPNEAALRTLLLREFHGSTIGGHSGINRTYRRLAAGFYWKSMRRDVRLYVQQCQVCQQMKSESLHPAGLLQPLPIPNKVFEDLALDFIMGLPNSNGKEAILVVVDRLTKYGHFFSLPKKFDSKMVAEVLVQGIVKLHGIPKSLVSDRDRIFLSELWTELAKLQGTELCLSSAYHPQSDGQTEALNRCLEMYLRCMATNDPNKWEKYLPWAEYWYNTAYQNSAGMTPFQALYGREPPNMVDYLDGSAKNDQVRHELQERNEILQILKNNLRQAQIRMKNQADKHRRELDLEVGNWVYVKLQPYRQLSIRLRRQQKLSPRFFGPYQVEKRVGMVAYKLKLPESSRIHPVFHISQLKLCRGHPLQQVTPLPLLNQEIHEPHPPTNLADKVPVGEGGNVMDAAAETAWKTHVERAADSHQKKAVEREGMKKLEPSVEDIPETRRSKRERKAPKSLTEFIRF